VAFKVAMPPQQSNITISLFNVAGGVIPMPRMRIKHKKAITLWAISVTELLAVGVLDFEHLVII